MNQACELPGSNPDDPELRAILDSTRTIAVVGLSDKPDRDSYGVSQYMLAQGYRIIPVNPNVAAVFGERSYATLRDVPDPIDMVNIFRKPEAVPGIVDEAIAARVKTIWMQLGIAHNAAAVKARAAGLKIVMNKCLMVEHRRLVS